MGPHLDSLLPRVSVLGRALLMVAIGKGEQGAVGEWHAHLGLQRVHVVDANLLARGNRHNAPAFLAQHADEGLELITGGESAGNGQAVSPAVGHGKAGGQTGRPGVDGLGHHLHHAGHLVVGGRPLIGLVAHHEQSQGGVADVGPKVEGDAPVGNGVQILGERLEVPGDALGQAVHVHVFDVFQRAGDEVLVAGPGGRYRKAAVAGDHRSHPVVARGSEGRIPEHLGVVVGVDVDEAGGHHLAAGVQLDPARQPRTDLANTVPGDGDIGLPSRLPRTVHH